MNNEQQKLEKYKNLLKNKEPLDIIPNSLFVKIDNIIEGTKEIARFRIFHALAKNGSAVEWSQQIY